MTTTVKYLIKFGSEENIKNLFEKGEVFMNTIKTFKDLDKKHIGDKYEGSSEIINPTESKLTFKFPNNPITINPTKMQLWQTPNEHLGNIYSTYAISDQLLKRKIIHRIDPRMQIFGSHCVIIKDVMGFLNGIFNNLELRNINYSHNMVTYYDYSKLNHKITLFAKSHLLSYQKEHRIIARTEDDLPLKFEIGSIENYSEIFTTKEFIKGAIVERI